jgi:hypothetical protein
MPQGLAAALRYQSVKVQSLAAFLLSQLALAGPATATNIASTAGIAEACALAIESHHGAGSNGAEQLAMYTALLVNNVVPSPIAVAA